jgi:hypothetical protein
MISNAWDPPDGWQPPPIAAEAVMTSILGVLHNHLVAGNPEPLISLLGPLMGVIVRPYLDPKTATREIALGEELAEEIQAGRAWPLPTAAVAAIDVPVLVARPGAHRARQCLLFIAQNPDASNRQIAMGIGVSHQGQVCTLLARLKALGLLDKQSGDPGHSNAWRLTGLGCRTAASLGDGDVVADKV